MNPLRFSAVVTCIAISAAASAQSCSGGPDGGMDASGCQCNPPPAIADGTAVHAPAAVGPLAGGRTVNRPPLSTSAATDAKRSSPDDANSSFDRAMRRSRGSVAGGDRVTHVAGRENAIAP